MNVNFYGYLYCTRAAFPHLLRSSGTLTAITSFSGEVGLPYRTAYCASKFAVTGFLEALRAEIADLSSNEKFDIVVVCPPSTNTNLRKNSLTSDEELKAKGGDDSKSMTVEDCASCVVDATDRKLRKAFFPWTSTVASYVRPLLPDMIDQKIWAKSRL
jgi:short-subunit dehydrogenase